MYSIGYTEGGITILSSVFAKLLSYPALMLRLSLRELVPKASHRRRESYYLELFSNGDMEARNVLIERNLRLVAPIIKKYYTLVRRSTISFPSVTIGLIKVHLHLQARQGVRLATYASRCIENEYSGNFAASGNPPGIFPSRTPSTPTGRATASRLWT
jgi:RNA polymerase sporulation-specific sigma factor